VSVPPRKVNAAVLLILATVLITLPILLFLGVFLWLNQNAFTAVDEIVPAELDSVRIELKNLASRTVDRPDHTTNDANTLDRTDPDVTPTYMMRPDFVNVLAPLREATEIELMQWPASAYLGKYEVKYKDGRGGTIMLYWATVTHGAQDSPAEVWMKIGPKRYRACSLKELRTVVEECATRGTKK